MAGRGPQTFKKRQKEQARKEKQLEKRAKKLERKQSGPEDGNTGLGGRFQRLHRGKPVGRFGRRFNRRPGRFGRCRGRTALKARRTIFGKDGRNGIRANRIPSGQ